MNQWKNFSKGFIKENAVFVLFLGLCPTLGVSTSAINGLGMGLATTFTDPGLYRNHCHIRYRGGTGHEGICTFTF